MKSPEEKAREYAGTRFDLETDVGAFEEYKGYLAGHASARTEAAELVEALTVYEMECANPAPDALYRRTLRNQLFDKLANYKRGEPPTAGGE